MYFPNTILTIIFVLSNLFVKNLVLPLLCWNNHVIEGVVGSVYQGVRPDRIDVASLMDHL